MSKQEIRPTVGWSQNILRLTHKMFPVFKSSMSGLPLAIVIFVMRQISLLISLKSQHSWGSWRGNTALVCTGVHTAEQRQQTNADSSVLREHYFKRK